MQAFDPWPNEKLSSTAELKIERKNLAQRFSFCSLTSQLKSSAPVSKMKPALLLLIPILAFCSSQNKYIHLLKAENQIKKKQLLLLQRELDILRLENRQVKEKLYLLENTHSRLEQNYQSLQKKYDEDIGFYKSLNKNLAEINENLKISTVNQVGQLEAAQKKIRKNLLKKNKMLRKELSDKKQAYEEKLAAIEKETASEKTALEAEISRLKTLANTHETQLAELKSRVAELEAGKPRSGK